MSSPPPDPPKGFGDELIHHGGHRTWSAEKEKILLGPFDYMYGQPGKDIRAQLIAAFNAWLKVPEQSLTVITKVVGMLHTASLLYYPFIPSLLTLLIYRSESTTSKTRPSSAAASPSPTPSSAPRKP